jgi:hypothetical protein
MNFDVFISYAHQDKAMADYACAALEADGIKCWIAPRDIAPGVEWAGAIVDALDRCRGVVLIFSSNANQSKQIYREVQRAFERAVPVVPVRVEKVEPAQSLAYYLGSVHWLDALTPPFEAHFRHLSVAMKALMDKQASGDANVGEQRFDTLRQWPDVSQPAFATRPSRRWLLGAAGAGVVAVAAAMAWLALRVPPSTMPAPRQAAAVEGISKGTMRCDKLPWTKVPLHAAVTLSIKSGNATFQRDVYSSDGRRKTGVESGTGTIDSDGTLQLMTSWVSPTSRFDGSYVGRLSTTGGTLAGKQILLVDGARHERPCSIAVGKFEIA